MIEKMKAVCVVAQASQREELLENLRELGTLHIAEKKSAEPQCLERFSRLSKLSLDLKEYLADGEACSDILSDSEFEEMYASSSLALERKKLLTAKKSELMLEYERLKPWGNFDSDLIKDLPEELKLHFYRLDKKAYKEIREDENIKFIRLASVEKMETVAVIGELEGSLGAIEFVIPDRGPSQLCAELEKCEAELLEIDKTLRYAAKHLKSCSQMLLKAENDAEYSSASETLTCDSGLVWITGYIPEAEEESFICLVKKKGWAWMTEAVTEDDGRVPTKIRYGRLTALIKPIFDILGVVPGYKEYDISFWFLAFFALFFAMIIGDAAYGTVFLIGTIIFNIKTKKTTNIMLLLYLMSFTTIIWGAVTGTWLGLEGAMKVPVLKALVIPNLANYPQYFNMDAGSVQNNVMKFCFSIGVIQLALACIMNIRRKIAEKSLGWLSDIGWLFSISALYFMVLNLVIGEAVNFGAIAGFVGAGFIMAVVFGGMSHDKTFSEGLKAGLGDAFTVFLNTISAFGNLMSYIRLFAVGMASLAIAQSFNDMASGFDGVLVIAGILIMVIGHLLNIIMGFLSVVVHGVRLNLLEFSGQLGMEWSGVSYEPFRKKINK